MPPEEIQPESSGQHTVMHLAPSDRRLMQDVGRGLRKAQEAITCLTERLARAETRGEEQIRTNEAVWARIADMDKSGKCNEHTLEIQRVADRLATIEDERKSRRRVVEGGLGSALGWAIAGIIAAALVGLLISSRPGATPQTPQPQQQTTN